MKRFNRLFVCAVISVALMAGCATERVGDTDQLAQGLTVLDHSEDSISVAYRQGDLVVYLQALRGHPAREPYASTPGFPQHEIDLRVMAADGRLLLIQRGGDDFVDPLWEEELENQKNLPAPEVPVTSLVPLVAEAAQVLEASVAAQIGADRAQLLAPELASLKSMGNAIVQQFADARAHAAAKLPSPDAPEAPEAVEGEILFGQKGGDESPTQYWSTAYYWLQLYEKDICEWWNLCLVGHHSATLLWKWQGSSWATAMYMCNHGTCPGGSGMGYVCSPGNTYRYQDFNLQTCRTGYNAISNSGHNCHDDSRVQMANFMEERNNNGWQQWCNDGDHHSDISAGPGDQGGYPNCSGTDTRKGYAYN